MINRVLIANRGEIAVRIIRACKEMNIKTVAVYSTADENSLHKELADEAYCIGGPRSKDSYLNVNNILSTACLTGCDAIHPGVGFLSENVHFARLVQKCGLIFIGPNPDIIKLMGNKATARETMIKAGVPVVPGSEVLTDLNAAKESADVIGYPILIKASNGGGGKGIKAAMNSSELECALNLAKVEAMASFGDDEVYMEKLLINPKHIEVQVLADKHGNVVHLFERDCSVQRNKQKLIEESPSVTLSNELKCKMYDAAIKACKYVNYDSVGTVEFLVVGEDFYFMEMNTRIQVEHPVTEMVTNIDLIKNQISVAANNKLKFKQEDIKILCHAIECRINAEDINNNFAPSPGVITQLYTPGGKGVRIDSCIYSQYEVPSYYDSLLLKLIVFSKSRSECIKKLRVTLEELIIEGINTNVDYHYSITYSPEFISGDYNIDFIEKFAKENGGVDQVISRTKTEN